MKKIISFSIFFILIIPFSYANLIINEIMADPLADEALNEWIELYNNNSFELNLSGYKISDSSDTDTIEGGLYNKEGTIIPAFGYAIITDEATRVYNNFNVSPQAIRLYVDDSSIGNGLSNNGETITLYDNNNNVIHSITYTKTSQDLSWSYVNGSLFKSDPTPGYNNLGALYVGSSLGCDFQTEIILSNTLFEDPDNFSFRLRAVKNKGTTTNFTMRAKIIDLFDSIIKEYSPFTNASITKQRTSSTYSPNLQEGRSYYLIANISTDCEDSDISNNYDSRLITIKGGSLKADSDFHISNIYDLGSDNQAEFGQVIRFRLEVYKGNTLKKTITAWIENSEGKRASKTTKVNILEKYKNYSLTLPLQIDSNCDEELSDGTYYLIVDGLSYTDREKFKIKGHSTGLCKVIHSSESIARSGKLEYELAKFNNTITTRTINSEIKLSNTGDKDIKIKLWSYVYKGRKCYSGERKQNMQQFYLIAGSSEKIRLTNTINEAGPGEYKYKILINKDNQKTNKEIIETIYLKYPEESSASEISAKESFQSTSAIHSKNIEPEIYKLKIYPKNIYDSVTEKTKKLAIAFLIIVSVALNIALITLK